MGITLGVQELDQNLPLSPLGEACAKGDINAIHDILESAGYMYDEGIVSEVISSVLLLFSCPSVVPLEFFAKFKHWNC